MGSPYINSWMINRAFSSQVLQSAGQNHPLDRGAAGSEVIDHRSCSEAKGFEQSSIYVRPACPQVHSAKEAAHGRISRWTAVAIPPLNDCATPHRADSSRYTSLANGGKFRVSLQSFWNGIIPGYGRSRDF